MASAGGPHHRRMVLALSLALVGCSGGSPAASTGGAPSATSGPLLTAQAGVDAVVELVGPPTEGAGAAPQFQWKAVEGAATYRLAVLDSQGSPIWAWQGSSTSVWLGGVSKQLKEGEAGPAVTAGSSWSVAALDADGHVLAVSPPRDVAP